MKMGQRQCIYRHNQIILTYCATCQPACPSEYWDRKPKPTVGQLHRHLSDFYFAGMPLLPRLLEKRSVTSHLPGGYHPTLALASAQKAVFSENERFTVLRKLQTCEQANVQWKVPQ